MRANTNYTGPESRRALRSTRQSLSSGRSASHSCFTANAPPVRRRLHVFSHVRVGNCNLYNVEESKDYGHSWA